MPLVREARATGVSGHTLVHKQNRVAARLDRGSILLAKTLPTLAPIFQRLRLAAARAVSAAAARAAGARSALGARGATALVGVVKARPLERDARSVEDALCVLSAARAANFGTLGHGVLDLKYIAACTAAIVITCHLANTFRTHARLGQAGWRKDTRPATFA